MLIEQIFQINIFKHKFIILSRNIFDFGLLVIGNISGYLVDLKMCPNNEITTLFWQSLPLIISIQFQSNYQLFSFNLAKTK